MAFRPGQAKRRHGHGGLRLGLLHPERVGNALVCRWNPKNPVAKALEPLFAGQPDEETLYANLKRWGAPLVRGGTPREKFSLEETLGRALVLARHHPDVARVWPVAFAKNRREVNLSELVMVARSFGQKRALGFFLSLTAGLLKDPSLAKSARHLSDGRARRVEDFFLFSRGDRARRLAEENAPRAAKEWLFRMNMPMDSFESLFRKFV